MAKFGKQYSPSRQVKKYAKEIAVAWHSALKGILEAGTLLNQSSKELGRKAWLDMVNNDLPFKRRTAEKLLKIAADKRFTSPKNLRHLPPRWTTLYELSHLSDGQFRTAIKKGEIHPDMERRDAEVLKAKNNKRKAANKRTVPIKRASAPAPSNGAKHINGQDTGDALAVISAARDLTDEEAVEVENELNILGEKYDLSFSFFGYSTDKAAKDGIRENLEKAMERWQKQNATRYNKNGTMTDEEVCLIEEAIYQLENKKYPRKKGGEYQVCDIRNPKNPHHEKYLAEKDGEHDYGVGWAYDYCRNHSILTKYTPLQFIDYMGYLKFLVFQHCRGNKERQEEIELELQRLMKKEEAISEGSRRLEEADAKGISCGDLPNDIHPNFLSTYRSEDLDNHGDYDPGDAKVAFDLLVR